MKIFLLAISLVLPFTSWAIDIDNFCSQFSWDNQKIECHKIAGRNYVDNNALEICNSFSFDDGKLNCLKNILNRSYTLGEVRTCEDQSFESDKLKCLLDLGAINPPPTNDPRRLEAIRKLAISATDALNANNLSEVKKGLDQILKLTNK